MNDTVPMEPYEPVECDHCHELINHVDIGVAIWKENCRDGVMAGRVHYAHLKCDSDVHSMVFHPFYRTKMVPLRDLCLAILDV